MTAAKILGNYNLIGGYRRHFREELDIQEVWTKSECDGGFEY